MARTLSGESRHDAGRMLWVGAGVLALTTLAYGLSRLHLGRWGLAVALVLAAAKALLIAWFFMHLSERPGGPRLVFATSFVFIVILVGLVVLEVGSRDEPVVPYGPFQPLRLPGQDTRHDAAPPREPPSERRP